MLQYLFSSISTVRKKIKYPSVYTGGLSSIYRIKPLTLHRHQERDTHQMRTETVRY